MQSKDVGGTGEAEGSSFWGDTEEKRTDAVGDEPGARQREGGAQQLPQLRVCSVEDRVIGWGDQRQS